MATNPQLQRLLGEAGLDTGTFDPREEVYRDLEALGFRRPQEEGMDIFQPVRTFFGAAGSVGGQLAGLLDPEAYERASQEVLKDLGYDAESPWYEKAEALPGLGDVTANMIPDEVRNSAIGRAVGPAGRMIGNILGDPTTYTPFVLSKLGGVIARAVPTAAPTIKAAALARRSNAQKVAAGVLTKEAARADDALQAAKVAQVVMREGTALQRMGFQTAEGLAQGGDLAMGAAAALAYGPQVVNAAWEGAKRIPEAETLGEGVIEGVNTTLMAGLSALMGKGLIDAATAARTVAAARSGKALRELEEQIASDEAAVLARAQEVDVPEYEGPITVMGERDTGAALPEVGEEAVTAVEIPEFVGPEAVTAVEIAPTLRTLEEPIDRRFLRRAPDVELGPEDLELLDLERARRRLEEGLPEVEPEVPMYEGPVDVVPEEPAAVEPMALTPDELDGEIARLERQLATAEPVNQPFIVDRLRALYDQKIRAEAPTQRAVTPKVEPTPEPTVVEPEVPTVEPEVPEYEGPVEVVEPEAAIPELPEDLKPYAEFVENKDLPAALEARGVGLDEFAGLPHNEKMAVLTEPAPEAPTPPVTEVVPETPTPEPVEAPEPVVEPVPEPEVPPEPVEPPTEPPTEPTPERAEDIEPEEPTPAEPTPEAPEETPFRQALGKAEDEFTDEAGTLHKSIRSIIEGRKSRGETEPADFQLAAEALNVLDDPALRRKLLDSTVDVDGKRVKIRDLPNVAPGRVYPAIQNWIRKTRLKRGGAGAGARGGAGVVEAAAEGLPTKGKGKKAVGKKAPTPGLYEQARTILDRVGLRYREFADEVAGEWTGALGKDDNKKLFQTYIEMREGGKSRADAIKALYEANKGRFSGTQSVRNLVGQYEKDLNKRLQTRFAADIENMRKELDAAEESGTVDAPGETPGATSPAVVDVAALSNQHKSLNAKLPVKPVELSVEGFTNQLKGTEGFQRVLEDYYRFAGNRAQKAGLGRKLPDTGVKKLAESLGINVPKGANVHWVIRKIGEKVFGIDPAGNHWTRIKDQQAVARAAAEAAGGRFMWEGWKPRRMPTGAEGWTGPNGTKVSVGEGGKTVTVDDGRGAQAKLDIIDMLANPQVDTVIIHEDVRGLGPLIDELPLVYDEAANKALLAKNPDTPFTHYRVDRERVPRIEGMETRDLDNPYDATSGSSDFVYRTMSEVESVMEGFHADYLRDQVENLTDPVNAPFAEQLREQVRENPPESTASIVKKLNAQLKKAGASALEVVQGPAGDELGEYLGRGEFHTVYRLHGVMDKTGRGVVMRIGHMPYVPLVTPEQRALMVPTLGHGKLIEKALNTGQSVFYTLHPEGHRFTSDDFKIIDFTTDRKGDLYEISRRMGWTSEIGEGASQYFNESNHNALYQRLTQERQLPDGVSLQDYWDDHAELMTRALASQMHISDFAVPSGWKTGQSMYIPLGPADKVHPNAVIRTVGDQKWQLAFSDAGVVRPNELSRAGTQWEQLSALDAIALKVAEGEPASRLTLPDSMKRHAHYGEDDIMGLDIGSDLKVVNHDRRADDAYVRALGELGAGLAPTLRGITKSIVSMINKDLDAAGARADEYFHAQFRGLTASPHLGGLYIDELGDFGSAIYVNPVEQVRKAGSYKEAVDDMLYTLFHEITHDKASGHGDMFRNIEEYIKGLRGIQDNMGQYRNMIERAFSEKQYRAMRDSLVPQFNEMRQRYGRPSWREEAVAFIPTRDVARGTARRAYRRGRGQEVAPRGRGRRVQPRGTVPRGGLSPTGELRSSTVAGGAAPPGRTQAEGFGYGGRGGYGATVRRIEELAADRGLDAENAKRLLDEFVETHKDLPQSDVNEAAWEMATKVVNNLTDDEVKEFLKGRKPSARGADAFGPKDAVWNLTQFEDLPDRLKARMLTWGEMTKGKRKRDRVRRWEDVDQEVKDLLGLDTPEGWALAFRRRGGGLKDSEVLLLREIHSELAGKMNDVELRFADAMRAGDEAAVEKMWDEMKRQRYAYFGLANKAADLLTEQARALAIARKAVRRMDPQEAFLSDLRAGIRERVKSKYRDPNEAERITKELFDEFMAAKDRVDLEKDPEAWADFYRAYRKIMGSKLWPDKIIEFYKAGLLGYSSRAANITSNALFRAVRYVEDTVAAGLDMVGSKLQGREREVFAGEAGVSLLAMRRAFAESFPKWLKANKDAFLLKPEDASKAFEGGGILEDLLLHPGAIEGKKGEFIRFAFKGLNADDQLAKHISAMDYMYRDIYRRLRKGEFKTKAKESYTEATERIFGELKTNYEAAMGGAPFDKTQFGIYERMFKEANEVAREDTFQKELGNMGRGVQSVLRDHPMTQIFIPFLRTPTNIAKETIKRTPLGFIEVARKWDKMTNAQRMSAMSRPLTGTAIGMGVLSMAMNGEVTGGGPIDPEDREALRATGWQPYSFKVGNQWVSYQRLEPIAAIFGVAADAAEGLRNGDFDKWNTGAMRVLQSTAENITNKTFLAGLDGVTSAISHPNLFLGRFAKQMQGSMIPNSLGFVPVGHMARAIDPTFRHADPMTTDVWKRKIPWLSTTVEPQYGPTGEPRQRGGSAIERLLSPFARWPQREGPEALGAEEIVRLGAAPSTPKRHMYSKGGVKVELLPEERRLLAQAMREATKVIGQRIVKDPNYLKLPDDENDPRWRYGQRTKKDVLQKLFRRYRSRVTDQLRRPVERRARQQYREQRQEGLGGGFG